MTIFRFSVNGNPVRLIMLSLFSHSHLFPIYSALNGYLRGVMKFAHNTQSFHAKQTPVARNHLFKTPNIKRVRIL